jgi:pimeloyl-ACP methyl ester carboxylesterase
MDVRVEFPRFKTQESRERYFAAYDAVLAEWPLAHDDQVVQTRLGPTHVVVSGAPEAPPLLLLPSFAGAAVSWRLNAAGLSRRYRTYAVDVIGQPGKSVAHRSLSGPRDYADWLTDLMDGLGLARASIVGCSFGGFLALNQALRTPERVDRVVLISPAGVFVSRYWRLIFTMRVKAPFLRLMRRLTGAPPSSGMGDYVRRPPRDGRWAALMGVTMAEAPTVSLINPPVFSRAQLRTIRSPTLLLIGEHETLYEPGATLALAQRRMPGLEGAIVPDADHIAAMAQPDDVNARILSFLADERV